MRSSFFSFLNFATVLCVASLNLPRSSGSSPASGHRISKEPSDGYVILKGSTIVYCKTENADDAWFECSSNETYKHRQNVHLHILNVPIIELQLEITRKDLDSYSKRSSDVFRCWCVSKSPTGDLIQSRKAAIRVAYIEKEFTKEPASTTGYLSSQVRLDCVPPDGFPKPRVHWFKNKVPHPCPHGDFVDNHAQEKCILTSSGTLIVQNLTLFDQGSYVCQAGNAAGTRASREIQLTVLAQPKPDPSASSCIQSGFTTSLTAITFWYLKYFSFD